MSTLYTIKGVLILGSEGDRVLAKYYFGGTSSLDEQRTFERKLAKKTMSGRGGGEIMVLDDNVVVFRAAADVMFYVLGSLTENELIVHSVLSCFFEAVSILLQRQVDKRGILENLDYVLLALDEIIDGGIILESDAETVASRVIMNEGDGEIALTEQSISQALASARDQITRSLLKG